MGIWPGQDACVCLEGKEMASKGLIEEEPVLLIDRSSDALD